MRARSCWGQLSGFVFLSAVTLATCQVGAAEVAAYGFSEGSGSQSADASGNGNDASLLGANWSDTGRFGKALSFDGASRASVRAASSLDLTSELTLEAWVFPTSFGGYSTVVMKEIPGELAYAIYANEDVARPAVWIRVDGASFHASGDAHLPLNAWTHVAGTYDGSTLRLYLNGVEAASTSVSGNITTSNQPLNIGGNQIWGEHFQGLIDEVRVHDRALTPTQIQDNMTSPITDSEAPSSVVIAAPPNDASVSGYVNVTARMSTAAQVAGMQFLLDGVNLGAEDAAAPYSVAWDTSSAVDGSHRLSVVERHTDGTTQTSPIVTVNVSNAPGSTLVIDGSVQYQVIDGLGVNANTRNWHEGNLLPAIDLLVNVQGANLWRVIVESHEDWETTNDNSNPFDFNWDYYHALYETPKFQGALDMIDELNRRNIQVMLNIMGEVPAWLGRSEILNDKEDEWVEMITSFLYYARNVRGVKVNLISPLNEEDIGAPEGPRVPKAQYIGLIRKLIARLDALGLGDIRIAGPDTASLDGGVLDLMPAMLRDPTIIAKVDHFVLHSYVGRTGNAFETIHDSPYPDRDFWISEYAHNCPGCDTAGQTTSEWYFSRNCFTNLLSLLDGGAAGAIVYDAYDSYYEHHGSIGHWGQLEHTDAGEYVPRKRFYANAQAFRFIAPGSRRIDIKNRSSDITALAFHNSGTGRVTIAGYNGGGGITVRGQMLNLPSVPSLELYLTNATVNMQKGPNVALCNNVFKVTIPADTIFTLATPEVSPEPSFVRGDSNRDGSLDLSDAVFVLFYLFLGGPTSCADAMDVDDTGTVNITDVVHLLDYLFTGGSQPLPPFPASGLDRTPDGLDCQG